MFYDKLSKQKPLFKISVKCLHEFFLNNHVLFSLTIPFCLICFKISFQCGCGFQLILKKRFGIWFNVY